MSRTAVNCNGYFIPINFTWKQADSEEVSNPRNQVLRSDEGIITNELAEEGIRGTVGAVVIDKGNQSK